MATNMDTCTICLDMFKQPKIINCFHTFCLGCLEDYTKRFTCGNFPCPICRDTIIIPTGGVKAFKNNFYINPCTEENACINHQGRKADVYCNNCYEAICLKCGSVKHSGHVLLDLEDETTLTEAIERAVSYTKQLIFHKEKLNNVKDSLEVKTSQLNTSKKTAHEKIDAKVEKICKDARHFGNQLKTAITGITTEQKAKLDTINTPIQELSSEVEFALNLSEKNTSNVPVINVLNTLKLSSDVLKKQSTVNLPDIPDIPFPVFNTNATNVVSAEQIGQCTTDKELKKINTANVKSPSPNPQRPSASARISTFSKVLEDDKLHGLLSSVFQQNRSTDKDRRPNTNSLLGTTRTRSQRSKPLQAYKGFFGSLLSESDSES